MPSRRSLARRLARLPYGPEVLALDLTTIRDVALAIAVGAVVLAVVAAIVVKWIVGKLVMVAILAVIAGVVWWQRGAPRA